MKITAAVRWEYQKCNFSRGNTWKNSESESFHPLFLPFSPLRSASCVRQEELQTAAPPAHPHENAPIYVPKSVRPLPPLPGKQHRFRCYHPIPEHANEFIKDTFLELLNQKSFTKITVTEICKNAEINRGTFNLHYYDIHDVLSDIFNDMTQDMLTTSKGRSFILSKSKSCSYPFCPENTFDGNHNTGHCLNEWLPFHQQTDAPQSL